jgi:hypothetical protein
MVYGSITAREAKTTSTDTRQVSGRVIARDPETCRHTQDNSKVCSTVAYPEIFSGGSTNSVEDRGQRKLGSGDSSPLVRGSAQFAN